MLNILAMALSTDLFILMCLQISKFRTALPFFMATNYGTIILYCFGKYAALLLFFLLFILSSIGKAVWYSALNQKF